MQKVSDNIKIFGADWDGTCIGRHFVDVFWEMPRINELGIEELIMYCKSNNIGAIIPTRDGELEIFASYKSILSDNGITVMVSDHSIVNTCLDKLKFAELESIQDIVIPAATSIGKLNADEFVVKERFGAGSTSIGLKLDKAAAQLHAASLIDPIYQPFQKGFEITVDAYVTKFRVVKGLIMRKRIKVIDQVSSFH